MGFIIALQELVCSKYFFVFFNINSFIRNTEFKAVSVLLKIQTLAIGLVQKFLYFKLHEIPFQ